jgi:hypothetical protein
MPAIIDNSFSQDSYGMRAERLNAIQTEFAAIQTELAAPASIATCAESRIKRFSQIVRRRQRQFLN